MKIHNYECGAVQRVSGGLPFDPHPLSTIFPPLDDKALDRLRQSMKASGFNDANPVVLVEATEQVADGIHRQKVAREIGIPMAVIRVPFKDDTEVRDYIIAANAARRHLTKLKLEQTMKKMAKADVSTKHIAEALGVSETTVKDNTVEERTQVKAEKMAKVKQFLSKGKTVREIAKAVGVSKSTVNNVSKSAGSGDFGQPVKPLKLLPKAVPMPAPEVVVPPAPAPAEETAESQQVEVQIPPEVISHVDTVYEALFRSDVEWCNGQDAITEFQFKLALETLLKFKRKEAAEERARLSRLGQ